MEEGKQLHKELLPKSPATKAFVEQWEILSVQDGMLQQGWEHSWLLVNPLSLRAKLLKEAHAGVSSGHLGRRKTLYHLC